MFRKPCNLVEIHKDFLTQLQPSSFVKPVIVYYQLLKIHCNFLTQLQSSSFVKAVIIYYALQFGGNPLELFNLITTIFICKVHGNSQQLWFDGNPVEFYNPIAVILRFVKSVIITTDKVEIQLVCKSTQLVSQKKVVSFVWFHHVYGVMLVSLLWHN